MKTPSPWLEKISVFFYRRLLVLYPADFRRAFGLQMVQLFRDACQEAQRRAGLSGLIRVWLSTLYDVASSVIVERSMAMQKHPVIKRLAWLSPVLIVILLLSVVFSVPRMSREAPASGPTHVTTTAPIPPDVDLLLATCSQPDAPGGMAARAYVAFCQELLATCSQPDAPGTIYTVVVSVPERGDRVGIAPSGAVEPGPIIHDVQFGRLLLRGPCYRP